MSLDAADRAQLQRTLALAQQAIGLSDPNPRVGCVLADAAGRVVAEGFTQQAGGPHAEAAALAQARERGASLAGGTAWVSLEPCAHHGRTPPCADALLAAGLARVVVACEDPFPQVAGQGLARLRAAGVQVLLADADLSRQARELNIGFFSRVLRGRPWVRMKIAASLDGRTALSNGQSQWITGEAARTDGHAWRKRAGAVLTGVGTVLDDDPRLDVRLVPTARQPLRVVVDSKLETPPSARILPPPGEVLLVGADVHGPAADALRASGAELLALPGGPRGKVDLAALLAELARRGVNELHVEAGTRLNGSFWREGLVDELLLYQAPLLLGPGRDLAALPELARLDGAQRLRFVDIQAVGDDLRLLARVPGRDDFLHSTGA
ncbi:riboflavin biosynthesis protein RibD [Burkholderiales bacterium JOSHI_001]|nr:riboflavin biosynthesis protein RibD [Burkholderiales bacterium JOSHI_001]